MVKLSYNKLWKVLFCKKMKKKTLMEKTGVSKATLAKMKRGEPVSLEVIARICIELGVDIGDIVELEKELFI